MDSKIMVQLSGVSKLYGEVRAVDDVSFQVREGEFCALLGPSGCGKTTTLRIIAGFEKPDAGDVLINAERCTELPPNRRNTVMVFQGYALFPHRTVLENVLFGLRMRRAGSKAQIHEKARQALKLVGLEGYDHRYPQQLSGGEQQRVALARAIVVEPAVLLMDEPLGALDLKLRKAMRYELKQLQHKTGLTTIYVTHDQEEAMSMADKVVVMNDGKIEQIGPPEEIYFSPKSQFVADFIGEPNWFQGTVKALEGADAVVAYLPDLGKELSLKRRDSTDRQDGLKTGDAVWIIVRSENVSLQQSPSGSAQWFRGRIVERDFLGASSRYYLKPEEGDKLIIADVKGERSGNLQAGAPICFGWDNDGMAWFKKNR